MRITHQMLTRNYLNRMDRNLTNLAKSTDKITSNRKFSKSWENVSEASKALRNRNAMAATERQLTTVRDAKGRANAAEDALRAVNTQLIRAEELVVQGLNGTLSETDRKKIATELERSQEEVFQIMNTTFADKHVFSAAGNATGGAPFTKNEYGQLMYQGYSVNQMETNPATGNAAYVDNSTDPPTYTDIKWNKNNYVDIGYGYTMNADGTVNANTAFLDTFSGIKCFGYGFTEEGSPINAYSLLGSMVDNLNNNNMDALGSDLNAIKDSMEYLLTSITEVGTRVKTLESVGERLDIQMVNLQERANDLEYVDIAEEIIHNASYELTWQVTLQMGSKLLPQSIFNFIS